ncbi:MAG: hypothetical protein WBD01_14975 [Salaquimonas sp.]
MNKLPAFNAIRLLLLVIAVSLAVLPLSVSHATIQNPSGAIDGSEALNHDADIYSSDHASGAEHENHAANMENDHQHETDSCCKAFCATFTVVETKTLSDLIKSQERYLALPNSAVLPGEFATPHRPPNA